ncbi:YkvA family protein [Candidatus Protofrankia californiensis]|uniref:YkvA family protein n=1 Tax=Candidatus Protofrankia californiensis TaxID=1839754 RepID=UPI001041190A|nr:YkvA family protein [Candidatus Protofrankia californiensis]
MIPLDKDAAREVGREIVTFVPDFVVMLRRVLADPRVSQSAKLEAAGALAYLVSPKNRLTNLIPVVGQLDDVAIVAFAFRRLEIGAGEAVLREHWRGSDRAFQIMLGASSALSSPRGVIRKVKLAKTIAESTIDRINASRRHPAAGADPHRVVEGEVVNRTSATDTPPSTPSASGGSRSDGSPSSGPQPGGSWTHRPQGPSATRPR